MPTPRTSWSVRRASQDSVKFPVRAALPALVVLGSFLFVTEAPERIHADEGGLASAGAKAAADRGPTNVGFETHVRPFALKYCADCHGEFLQEAGIDFHTYPDEGSVLKDRDTWEKVAAMLKIEAMPPEDHQPQPGAEEIERVVAWLDAKLFKIDCELVNDPGRVTIRRLNAEEYNNTVRDLLGIDFQPGKDFPSDDVGYGFDNIGDVLSLPPLLMEKYLDAAEQIAEAAIVSHPFESLNQRRDASKLEHRGGAQLNDSDLYALYSNSEVYARFLFPAEGEYVLRAEALADQAGPDPARMEFRIDGRKIQVFDIEGQQKPAVYQTSIRINKGDQRFGAAFINDYYQPNAPNPRDRGDRNLYVRYLEIQGPLDAVARDLPETHRRIVFTRPGENHSLRRAAEQVLDRFASRAFRRPVQPDELSRLADLVETAVQEGESFERGVQLGVMAVLVSPHFLFRVEMHPDPENVHARRPINDYEFASRLSYFLWSSMPDDELFALAENGSLSRPDVAERQVRRMLQDEKAAALVKNFGGQWLNLRNLNDITPDPNQFAEFDEPLRADMRRETELFFEAVMREDRSVLDFLRGDFTFVNERLARHYGLSGIRGDRFRKAPLAPEQGRAGVLTHASILTLTSNPTRTSPVKRGKWILENIFDTPPPPAPPNVPELEETAQAAPNLSLREQMQLHSTNPGCASCHRQMDPLGLGFENFDAIGRWRERDGKFAIDASGVLPSGEKFAGPLELLRILSSREAEFSQCLTKKMLTYALGRGLELYDQCAVDDITEALEKQDYRFSALVIAIVNSDPFRMRRGEGGQS